MLSEKGRFSLRPIIKLDANDQIVEIINFIIKGSVIVPIAAKRLVILLTKYNSDIAIIAEKSIIPTLKKLKRRNQFRYGSVIE